MERVNNIKDMADCDTKKYEEVITLPYSYYGGGTVKRKSDGRVGRLYECDSIPDIRNLHNEHPAIEVVIIQSEYAPEMTRAGIIIYREPHKAYPPIHFESREEYQTHKQARQ